MHTLLIDNHDSFTYNLAQLLGVVNGREPTVIRNDEPGWDPAALDGFDTVVLSPGPGTPGVAADFGICADVVRSARIPLLGVCLGHQGVALLAGGSIGLAPEPRHGRRSTVLHAGADLFDGIPSPLEVVRYHSWIVDRLPADLAPLAWTQDRILMALRHRTRPQWGVQFHPESIATDHGDRLLANFGRLSREWNARHGRRPARARLAPPPAPPPTDAAVTRYTLHVESFPTDVDGPRIFAALFAAQADAFWLDSGRDHDGVGRFSVLGAADGPLAEVVTADVATRTVTVTSARGRRVESTGFLDWLDARLRAVGVAARDDLPFAFRCGWVGLLGYELKAETGGAAAHRSPTPDAAFMLADRCVVLDHATRTTYLLALHTGDDRAARQWCAEARERIRTAPVAAAEPPPPLGAAASAGPPPPAGTRLTARHDRDAYLGLIEACHDALRAGETYEVCLTNELRADVDLEPLATYAALRRRNPVPFGALLRFGDLSVLSTSPERFLRIDADGRIEARPIKGTRPRGATPQQDAVLRADLGTAEKDRSENLMIVDLLRNDLGRVAAPGSVAVPELFAVETYETVHQLVSTVTARLRADRSPIDCVRAAFPGGSMTGAPKERTMAIIDRLEGAARGVYAGAIGYCSLDGAIDLSIAIRTLVLQPGRLTYGVGGAVVAMSDPEEELAETVVKAAPLLGLLGAAAAPLTPAGP